MTIKHKVSETGSVAVFGWVEGDTYSVGPLERDNLNRCVHWRVAFCMGPRGFGISPLLKTETDAVYEMLRRQLYFMETDCASCKVRTGL
jgi:hypothetical protein